MLAAGEGISEWVVDEYDIEHFSSWLHYRICRPCRICQKPTTEKQLAWRLDICEKCRNACYPPMKKNPSPDEDLDAAIYLRNLLKKAVKQRMTGKV
jgi:hypothetical protein